MTKQFLNTLFVMTEGAYVHLESDTVRVVREGETMLQTPLHHLGSICVFGHVSVSTPLIARCADDGRAIVMMDEAGRFKARIVGRTTGNVLLRKGQHDFHNDPDRCLSFARCVVAGKIQNGRQVLLRGAREDQTASKEYLADAAITHAGLLDDLRQATTLDEMRGIEGSAAQAYFEVFDLLIRAQRTDFRFSGRSRRPPRDRMNALLSFVYALATNDCESALEGVGLDPQLGILHALRPGRPGLALDLLEEFRPIILDRLCLTLVNRQELTKRHFLEQAGGSVRMTDEGRKRLLVAFQKRKQEMVSHPLLKEKVPIGLLPHIQARIIARLFRGEMKHYQPFTVK
jgi:CRISPR-associated protein Cas1